MALRWWPVGLLGLSALIVTVLVAVLLPLPEVKRLLRPLANVGRLTQLPLYRRAALVRLLSLIVTAILLGIVFACATLTSARPTGFSSATKNFETVHPLDIMVCVGQPVTDVSTAGLLNYFGGQISTFSNQRIGLTSPTRRVVPMTRDYAFATETLAKFAGLAGVRHALDANNSLADSEIAAFNNTLADFSRTVDYVDYSRSVEDVLALCIAGFPLFEGKSNRRRELVYLGYGTFGSSAETRPALYSTQGIKNMAAAAGVQINAIVRTDIAAADPKANESLSSIVDSTGGRFSVYNPAGTAGFDGTDPTLAAILKAIDQNPPQSLLPNGKSVSQRSWDYPNLPLAAAVVAATLLCASLLVLRR